MSAAKNSWPRVRLGDVCEVVAGQSPEGRYYTTDSSFTEFHQGSKNFGSWELLPSGVYTEKTTKIVEPGTLLISVRAPVGDLNITPRQICIGRGLAGLLPVVSLDRDFLCYFLTAATKSINDAAGAGSCFSSISMKQLSRLTLPLPPLSTQREIVARLEKELGQVDELAKKFAELETTAEAEFKATLKETFEALQNKADGTRMVKLGEVCETSSGGTPLRTHSEYYEGGEIPWLRSGEVCTRDITSTEMKITQLGMDNSSAKMFPKNSVVVAMYGATAGQVGILRIASTTNQAVCCIFPCDDIIPEYLYYQLFSMRELVVSHAVGGAQPNISQQKIKDLDIPLPPLATQREIVARLDAAKARKEALVDAAKRGLTLAAQMRKAILKEAFE